MSTTTAVSPDAPELQPRMSAISRVFGGLFRPQKTFEAVVRKPGWIMPIALLTLLSVAVSFGLNQRVNWREFISQQIEKSPQASQMSAEQKEQRIEGGAKFSPIFTYAVGICSPVVFMLVVALVMWGAYNLFAGANTNFSTSFGITAHAALPGLISSILFILTLYLRPYGSVDLENPIATNLAVALPEDSAKWLLSL